MDDLRFLHDDHVFGRSEALERGYSDDDLQFGLRAGFLVRIRQGAYTFTDVWSSCDELERHRLRAHAVLRSHRTPLALSHTSAAVEHGLRLFEPDLSRVHVTCLDRSLARSTRDIVYHDRGRPEVELAMVGDSPVVSPARAALGAASLTSVSRGLVILDSVADLGLGSLDELHREFRRISGTPYSRKLQITVRLARVGATTVAESLARYLMWEQHLPEPVLQFEVRDEWGHLIGTTDFAWPEHGVLGEFDGMMKYGRLLREGETPGQAVEREKKREDALRAQTGWLMVRIIWPDLFRPGPTAAKIRRQLERGRSLKIV